MENASLQSVWEQHFRPLFPEECLERIVTGLAGSQHGVQRWRYAGLDNAATTPPFRAVLAEVNHALQEYGSVHRGSGQLSKATTAHYDRTRIRIKKQVDAPESHYVIFTKNTTEAINQVAALIEKSLAGKHKSRDPFGDILISDIEHSSNFLPWVRHGTVATYATNPDGTTDLDIVEDMLRGHHFKVLAVTAASNVTGYQPPIYELARLAHRYDAKIVVDACQLVPHHPIAMLAEGAINHLDFIAFSGHKMYAPFGTGVLVGSKEFFDSVKPYQIGGGNIPYIDEDGNAVPLQQERAHDPGTPNAIGAIALERAFDVLESSNEEEAFPGEGRMRNRIAKYERGLVSSIFRRLQSIPKVKVYIPEPYGTVIPFDVESLPAKLVSEVLAEEYGVGTRAGSFCAYKLLRRLKRVTPEEDAKIAQQVRAGVTVNIPSLVRASFSIFNRPEDGDRVVAALEEISRTPFSSYERRYHHNPQNGNWSYR